MSGIDVGLAETMVWCSEKGSWAIGRAIEV